jgi:Ca-activated chloride channel family protein
MNRVHWECNLRKRSPFCILFLLLLVRMVFVQSQSRLLLAASKVSKQATISVTTELVVLPVNVTDSNGAFVPGLQKRDFRVYEDGTLQKVTLFAEEDTPVTVGLLVDHSRSMGPKLPEVRAAVSTFVHSSNPEDEMFVIDFSDNVSIEALGGKAFTSDAKILEKALLGISAQGQTALYDAVGEGLKHLQLGVRDQKALVIVSDGGDNASRLKYSDVLSLARQTHALIYSIVLAGNSEEEENPQLLEKLCRETGGIAFFPQDGQRISDIAKAIALDLREQYTLGYAPEKKLNGNSFRKIAVRVDAPSRGRLRVRTRAGFLAPTGKASALQSVGDRQ